MTTTEAHGDSAPGYIFAALKEGAGEHGPMIVDDQGQLVWFGKYRSARDFKMQLYQGRSVLTWWEGKVTAGHGVGEYVIFDCSYREIARVRAGNGYRGDLHEFLITPEDTALLVAYAPRRWDFSPIGGSQDGMAWDGIVQEVETGEVLAGSRQSRLEPVGSVPKDSFETVMLVRTFDPYVAVRAKDRLGQPLGTSAHVKL